jgi:hypothetical protein
MQGENKMNVNKILLASLIFILFLAAGCQRPASSDNLPNLTPAVVEASATPSSLPPTHTLAPVEASPTPQIVSPTLNPTQAAETKSVTPKPTVTATKSVEGKYAPKIVPANFVKQFSNPYFPMIPGTTFTYEGKTEKGNERNEVTITTKTKKILGVTCAVVSGSIYLDDKLAEKTSGWYAEDKNGNIWFFGQDARQYKDGKTAGSGGSWQAGLKGAQPGIIMQARPEIGVSYRQDYYKGKAEDMAQVVSLSETASVPNGDYKDLLLIKTWSALEPTLVENKFYAKDVGLILIKGVQGWDWELQLVKITKK